ncbi:CmpA/NrtA family ABC transporter substrate-binding protein [Pyruvatibacter sp. HU-CL02332]|uniref:ABC transporter substrate-binding protein n=1 Tax=Pyruvatibacter sp. HU-CL02332 TaxID=3127650 RepID=UPI00310ACDFC
MSTETLHITAGFIPLLDAAMLIVAREKGFAADQAIDLELVRETSWASIRDRVVIGHFDAAHMLAPMAIAGSLALPPLPMPFVAPIALGTGRNAITVSNDLWQLLADTGLEDGADAASAVKALAKAKQAAMADRPLVFAAVHTYSAHAYLLRYWLAEGGLFEGRDVRFEFVPPPFMGDALASGAIDGCCVGEPWNTAAVANGHGRVLTTGDQIWAGGPDKVLGMREDWASKNPRSVHSLVRALQAAALWADDPQNTQELAEILSGPAYLDTSVNWLLPGLSGEMSCSKSGFARGGASLPDRSHAIWFAAQMARWGEVELSASMVDAAAATYQPDVFAEALGDEHRAGAADEKGATCQLFDAREFNPEQLDDYLAAFQKP